MKARYVRAALAAIAVAVPSIASAETTIIKKYGDRDGYRRAHAEFNFHRRHHFDRDRKVIIIKHRHHHRMY
jgi:hypothetical protein